MKSLSRLVFAGSLLATVLFGRHSRADERWSHEVGVVDYFSKYTQTPPDRTGRRLVQACFDAVKAAGIEPEWVDVDIFLPARKRERELFKRIVIPACANWFSRTMYEGMDEYVLSGGLLITNSSLVLLDANDNYMVDDADTMTDIAQKRFLGVVGQASCRMTKLRVLHECPLTTGVELGTWLSLTHGTSGRKTRNTGAHTIANSNRIADGRESEQPFLTFKHSGKGACIYLVGSLAADGGEQYTQLVRNLFAPRVLDWLCLQE